MQQRCKKKLKLGNHVKQKRMSNVNVKFLLTGSTGSLPADRIEIIKKSGVMIEVLKDVEIPEVLKAVKTKKTEEESN